MTPGLAVPQHLLTVRTIPLTTGEKLPVLIDATTGLPKRVATRWVMTHRRLQTQLSTLTVELRMLAHLYRWAWDIGHFDLDDFLVAGQILEPRQITSFASFVRKQARTRQQHQGGTDCDKIDVLSDESFNRSLAVAQNFLLWALYPEHRGGAATQTLERLATTRTQLTYLFQSLRIPSRPTQRLEPLTSEEITAIRRVIAPVRATDNSWSWGHSVFTPATRLRNWLMVEMALELGLRRGELLKLRLDSLPRGPSDVIVIKRYPDDPHDTRIHEPAVKTAERAIPASRWLLSIIRAYRTDRSPLGRRSCKTPYLFTTSTGKPLSSTSADAVIQKIGVASGVQPLSWHCLRHTWAESWALQHFREPNSIDVLMHLGGWTNRESALHYIQYAIAQQAQEDIRQRNTRLYDQEYD